MINTFNLEQNLLTFPSERDILTGGSGSVGAVEDGWRDGRLLTCPRVSVRAAALPAGVPGHTGECGQRNPGWPPWTHSAQMGPTPRGLSRIGDGGKHYS